MRELPPGRLLCWCASHVVHREQEWCVVNKRCTSGESGSVFESKLQGCELLMSCFEMWARVRLGGLEGVMHNGTEPMRACMMHYFFFVRGQAGPLHNCAQQPDAIVTRRGSERAELTDR